MNPLAPLAVVGSALTGAITLAAQSSLLPSFAAVLKGESAEDDPPLAEKPAVDLQGRLEDVAGQLRQRLANAGIDLAQPIEFSLSASGGIEVSTEHPQWRAIEELLHESPGLAGELAELFGAAVATSDDLAPDAQLELRADDAALTVEDELVAITNEH